MYSIEYFILPKFSAVYVFRSTLRMSLCRPIASEIVGMISRYKCFLTEEVLDGVYKCNLMGMSQSCVLCIFNLNLFIDYHYVQFILLRQDSTVVQHMGVLATTKNM